MKTNFYIFLSIIMALVFASSCNETDEYLPRPLQEENLRYTTVPYTITVGITPILDKLDGVNPKTTFINGDAIKITNPKILAEPAILTSNDYVGKDKAVFSGELKVKLGENIDGALFSAALINADTSLHLYNNGWQFQDVKEISDLQDGLDIYSSWRCEDFDFKNDKIELRQFTTYVEYDMPFNGANVTITYGNANYEVILPKHVYLAVPYGASILTNFMGYSDCKESLSNYYYKIAFNKLVPKDCIPGLFSIGENTQCYFSKGNLQYNIDEDVWRFAPHQYDKCFLENESVGKDYATLIGTGRWTDLFGWGTWLEGDEHNSPLATSTENEDYIETYDEDGCLVGVPIIGYQWTLLTGGLYGEWNYLLFERENADSKYGIALVAGVEGLILLPDVFLMPDGIADFKPGLASNISSSAFGEQNNYTADEWELMEASGAVFLPTTGYRGETKISNANENGAYRSLSLSIQNQSKVYHMSFYSNSLSSNSTDYLYRGRAVRLIQKIEKQTEQF